MKHNHESKPRRVSEPVQVYLDPPDRARLDRMTSQLALSKSDVLRRALQALENQLTDPSSHPALRIIGIAEGHERRPSPGYDVASEHDRYLADAEIISWKRPVTKKSGN